jgi:Zn-dependent protease with chaperone function
MRLHQRAGDRAAQRVFERLAADPGSFGSVPSTGAATAVSATILVVAGLYVGALVWGTLHVSGLVWVPVVLGWLAVIVLRPRVPRLPRGAMALDEAEYPGLYALVRRMARAVGAREPQLVAVDVGFGAHVTPVGVRRRAAIVLGLPLMTLLPWRARLGAIGHELGHLRAQDTVRGQVLVLARTMVAGLHRQLAPPIENLHGVDLDHRLADTGGLAAFLTRAVQTILATPFLLLGVLLDRTSLTEAQHREYLADRRAASVVGTDALVELLVCDPEGIATATAAAARRGEDPFKTLAERPPPTAEQRAGRLAALARERPLTDPRHPPADLRIRLLEGDPRPPGPEAPGQVECARAEQELDRLRSATTRQFRDALRSGAYG